MRNRALPAVTVTIFLLLVVYLVPTTNVSASHDVSVWMYDTGDGDRFVLTDNQTLSLTFTVDYSGATSGHAVDNINITVPQNFDLYQWMAPGDHDEGPDYWEDQFGTRSDGPNWVNCPDLSGGQDLNLSANGNIDISAGEGPEAFQLEVNTPDGGKSGVYRWTINLTDTNGNKTSHDMYIAAGDADDTNGYDIMVDARDNREGHLDEVVPVDSSTMVLPLVNGGNHPLHTDLDEFPDDPLQTDTVRSKNASTPESGLLVWEDGTDFWSRVTGDPNHDIEDAGGKREYLLSLYPDTGDLSPAKDLRQGGAKVFKSSSGDDQNFYIMRMEKIDISSLEDFSTRDRAFSTNALYSSDIWVRVVGRSQTAASDPAQRVTVVEVGDPADRITSAEIGTTFTDSGTDGIYISSGANAAPFNISALAGHWDSVPGHGTDLRIEGEGNNQDWVSFEYARVDDRSPVISSVSITSNVSSRFYEADTDMSNNDDIVYFNSLAGEGAGQVITLDVAWSDDSKWNLTATAAYGDQPLNDTGEMANISYSMELGSTTRLITVRAIDDAGRYATYNVTFQVDNDDPDPPTDVQVRPDGIGDTGEYDNDPQVFVTWSNGTDAGSGLKGHRMGNSSICLDNPPATSGSGISGIEGLNLLYVFALDNVGNNASASDSITIDTIPPVITGVNITSDRPGHFHVADLDMEGNDTVYFNSLDGEGAGQIITMDIGYNETNLDTVVGSQAYGDEPTGPSGTLEYSLEAGANSTRITVKVVDLAVNNDTYFVDLVADNVDPLVELDEDLELAVNQDHTFEIQNLSDGLGIANVTWYFGDGTTSTERSPTHGYGKRGVYNVILRATDLVGNRGSDRITVLVNSPPVLEPIGNQTIYEGTPFSLQVEATDPDGDNLTFGDDTDLFDISPSTGLISFTPEERHVGVIPVNISVTDGLVTVSEEIRITILNKNSPPRIEGLPDQIITRYDTDYFFDITPYTWDDDPLPELEVMLSTEYIRISPDLNTSLVMNYPKSMEGKQEEVTVTVDDGVYADNDTFTVTVGDNYPPERISPLVDQTFPEDGGIVQAFDLDDHFRDEEDGKALNYTWFGNENVILEMGSDNQVNLTAKRDWYGSELVTVRCYDSGSAFVEDSLLVTVTSVNDPPVFEDIPDIFIRFEESYEISMERYLSDADHRLRDLALTISSDYASLSANHSMLSFWYPESLNGSTEEVTLTATDGEYSDETTFTITVSDNYPPTVMEPLPDLSFDEDTSIQGAFALSDHFRDRDGSLLTYEINGNDGVRLSIGQGGMVDVSAVPNFFGKERVTVKAIDSKGAFVEDDMMITVKAVNDPPVISSIPDQEAEVGELVRLELAPYISDVDDDVDTLLITTDKPDVSVFGTTLLLEYNSVQEDVVLVTVSDGEAQDQASFQITVKDADGPNGPSSSDGVLAEMLLILLVLAIIIGMIFTFYFLRKGTKMDEVSDDEAPDVGDEVGAGAAGAAGAAGMASTRVKEPPIVLADGPEDIELGMNYLFEDDSSKRTFRTLEKLCDGTVKGLALTNRHPKKLDRKYDLGNVKVFWLSDMDTDFDTLDPSRLDFEIMKEIGDFMRKRKENGVLVIDGLRQMIMATSYDKVFDFISSVIDMASTNGSTLILRANPGGFVRKELSSLEDLFDEIRRLTRIGPTENGGE